MKFVNELLGFAVLTGPLWLILILLAAATWISVKVAKRFKSLGAKFGIALLVFVLFFLMSFGDEIVGRIYLNRLCASDAGVKVYKTVELPPEYWDKNGEAKFFNTQGYLDHDFWAKRIDESAGSVVRESSILNIEKNITKVIDRGSQALLGEITTFKFWGGWVRRNLSPANTANSCQYIYDPNFSREFYGRLFIPLDPSK
jgi:hypothetical protein